MIYIELVETELIDDRAEDSLGTILQKLSDSIAAQGEAAALPVLEDFLRKPEHGSLFHSMLIAAAIRIKNHDLLHIAATQGKTATIEMSPVEMPVGLISPDAAAMLGRDGYIFLVGGSNDVLGQYDIDQPSQSHIVEQWVDRIERRNSCAKERNIQYFHIIVPEKITIIPELFPVPVMVPTSLLGNLESRFVQRFSESYVSARTAFWYERDRHLCCKKTDSHLSTKGTLLLFRSLMAKIAGLAIPDFPCDEPVWGVGDLIFRLVGYYVAEHSTQVSDDVLPSFVQASRKISESSAAGGGHMGFSEVWANDDAPLKKKIVVFGNSFFSSVGYGQSTLSWWFSRWFSEFHFLWTNEVDWNYVDDVQPDIVLWQGVERFLPIVPAN